MYFINFSGVNNKIIKFYEFKKYKDEISLYMIVNDMVILINYLLCKYFNILKMI